ncbi:uncharacterized protein B0H64DRAFT_182312 [Chaetomium fimeti]|uniref:Uncharacterized protein n=1 Tax=Chaetomium fimeti TaxID=1854472 RepID=A0AAE0HCT9_9PEZI|nr:hypothetical protein B0H64DRAFT_182312 [Chaetomium fimeti]
MSDFESVPLPPSLRKRFYEPVILLDALRGVYRQDESISEPDLESGTGKSQKETYFCFLNKLSQICDSQKKKDFGKTVSAIVVLEPGSIEYRLASNKRDSRELDTATEYLTDILNVLGHVTDQQVNDKAFMATVSSGILHKILAFNRTRVELYLNDLVENDRLDFCVNSSATGQTADAKSVAEALRSLQPHIQAARGASQLSNDDFVRHSEALLQTIHKHYEPTLEDYMKQKTRGENNMVDSPWNDVRHALGRLLSYFIAIKVLISARKYWPRLFVDFEVTSIPSSQPQSDPPAIRRNASGIISRMSRSKAVADAYQERARHLQAHKLDERIRDRVKPNRFQPIVHAEVNLLTSVLASQAAAERDGEDPLRFFHEAEFGAYIGSSKPTCLLCAQYFKAHPSGVACRASHGNLYFNWRAPDVSVDDGPAADQQRRDILEAMVKEVRNETTRAILERSYTRRKHDSWDTPSNPLRSSTVGATLGWGAEEDELASRMGQVNLDTRGSMRSGGVMGTDRRSARSGGGMGVDRGSVRSGGGLDMLARARGIDQASTMGQINDTSSMRAWSDGSRETTPEAPTHVEDNEEDDDEDGGGAKL